MRLLSIRQIRLNKLACALVSQGTSEPWASILDLNVLCAFAVAILLAFAPQAVFQTEEFLVSFCENLQEKVIPA